MTIEEATKRFHWIQVAPDGVVEMFLDHHMLSNFRSCEALFELQHMANIRGKGRSWNLEFGITWHKMVEVYYQHHMDSDFSYDAWLATAAKVWHENKMEDFADVYNSGYHKILGLKGFIVMLAQYAQFFAAEVDRLRLIGLEITFGKKREVPIGSFFGSTNATIAGWNVKEVRCYLTGRIDFLMDDGRSIGPLDHKTTVAFGKKNMSNEYDPQEGMTGYVYATKKIVASRFPELLSGRTVNKIWMNFAQTTPCDNPKDRFRRTPIYKTEFQLEEWRLRNISTFQKIYELVISGRRPDWNTAHGCKFFNSDCAFKRLHQQNSSSNMLTILQADFVVAKPWDTETINEERKEEKDAVKSTVPTDVV